MGHREDLLAGAVRCLREKGYAHTTARDIVAASGTNLASIGYHYGSTKALLNAAVLAAMDEFGEEMARAIGEPGPAPWSPAPWSRAPWSASSGSGPGSSTRSRPTARCGSPPSTSLPWRSATP